MIEKSLSSARYGCDIKRPISNIPIAIKLNIINANIPAISLYTDVVLPGFIDVPIK